MRICLDVSQTVYEGTGSGRYVIELVKALLCLQERQNYILFGSARARRDVLSTLSKTYKSINVWHELKESYHGLPPAFFEIVWNKLHVLPIEWFSGPIDIYHSSDWTQAPSKSKKVTTVHDLIPFLFPEHVHPRIREAHELRWKHILEDEVTLIVDAESTKRDIVSRFPIKQEKIHVIPLGCNQTYFQIGDDKLLPEKPHSYSVMSNQTLQNYGLVDKKYVLAVGTLEPRKNIKRLIEAYQNLEASIRKEFSLVIVGKKSWSDEFEFVDNVIFTGYVPEHDLPYLYANARCFVLPSLYEGFGIPVLEAMACGTPVVCSDSSSLPEIGGDDVHYISDPENVDSIRLVLQHVLESSNGELDSVARKAQQRAKQFSWKITAIETLGVYKSLT